MKQNRKYIRIEQSVTMGHREWRKARRSAPVAVIPFSDRVKDWMQAIRIRITAVWDKLTKVQIATGTLFIGLLVGLIVLGWWLFPVQWDATAWTGADYNNLPLNKRTVILQNSAELYSYTHEQARVESLISDWPDVEDDICQLVTLAEDVGQKIRYQTLIYIKTGNTCAE